MLAKIFPFEPANIDRQHPKYGNVMLVVVSVVGGWGGGAGGVVVLAGW